MAIENMINEVEEKKQKSMLQKTYKKINQRYMEL